MVSADSHYSLLLQAHGGADGSCLVGVTAKIFGDLLDQVALVTYCFHVLLLKEDLAVCREPSSHIFGVLDE